MNWGLVKQIGVDSVIEGADANQAFIESRTARKKGKNRCLRVMTIWVNTPAGGPVKKAVVP